MLEEQKFSVTDYEFRLSDGKGDENKYYIGAFYNKKELAKGKKLVAKWEKYMNETMIKKESAIDTTQITPQTFSQTTDFCDDESDFPCAGV